MLRHIYSPIDKRQQLRIPNKNTLTKFHKTDDCKKGLIHSVAKCVTTRISYANYIVIYEQGVGHRLIK